MIVAKNALWAFLETGLSVLNCCLPVLRPAVGVLVGWVRARGREWRWKWGGGAEEIEGGMGRKFVALGTEGESRSWPTTTTTTGENEGGKELAMAPLGQRARLEEEVVGKESV